MSPPAGRKTGDAAAAGRLAAARNPEPAADPPRMTLGRVVELLLAKGGHAGSSVSLTRNAKGETQIEVVVRTGDDVPTTTDAELIAQDVFDRLRARYPMSSGYVGATTGE